MSPRRGIAGPARAWLAGAALLACAGAAADDTDVYLNPSAPTGGTPLVMFALDYRSNLGATVCNSGECDQLVAEGYLPAAASYTFFDVLRAVFKKVLDPLTGVRIGFMMNHANSCTGGSTSGPYQNDCSNGAYVLSGFRTMAAGSDDAGTYQLEGEDPGKVAMFAKLDAIPTPGGTLNHSYQGKELYFELFRYLTGQWVYNGHVGYEDFGDNDRHTNLDVDLPAAAWDTAVEEIDDGAYKYVTPLTDDDTSECTRIFVINLMFQVANQEDDSDDAIRDSKDDGGMGGIVLRGATNSFDTVIRYLRDVDLADGSYGEVDDIDGKQNVLSYFLVDPTKINQTTNGYADAGGTGTALPLSEDPEELIATLNNIFKSILSVSTTFVAPSVPVNVFNRAETVHEVFMALFEADEDGFPRWDGNLKKLRIAENSTSGEKELQDVLGNNAIDIDGRIKREAITYWTLTGDLPPPEDDEVDGADGRAVARGGGGQRIPGFVSGGPKLGNGLSGARQLFVEKPSDLLDGLAPLDADAVTAALLWTELTEKWDPPASAADYASATSAEQAHAENLLRFARGLEDDGTTTRPWLLADPLHSRPRPVNYGARADGYDAANPDIRLLMGSNDGFMHMFRNTHPDGTQDGTENWAFMPRAAVPLLERLRTNAAADPKHPASVDGSAVVYTVDQNLDGNLKSGDGDKAYAYFGLRRGGKHYYALDISDPDAPALLWTIGKATAGFGELGQTWSSPQVGHVQVANDVIPVLVFGAGYNGDDEGDNLGDLGKDAKNRATNAGTTPAVGTDDDEGNAIFIVHAVDGTLVWKAVQGVTASYDSSTKAYVHPDMLDSIPAEVTAVDTDGDGLLDRIYAGDTGGVVWRVDLAGLYDHDNDSGTPDVIVRYEPSVWQVSKLITVGRHATGHTALADDRRFFNRPDVVQSRDDIGPYDAVLIGSGDREDPNGTGVSDVFYMVKDRATTSGAPSATTLEDTNLADLTDNCLQDDSCASAPNLAHGWRIDLSASGEKNLAAAVTAGGNVFFTTFAPTPPESACSLSEGVGRLYVVALQDATAVINFDTSNDAEYAETYERSDVLGSGGIPVEVVPLGEGLVLVQGQEAGQNIVSTSGRTSFKTYWHEYFQ